MNISLLLLYVFFFFLSGNKNKTKIILHFSICFSLEIFSWLNEKKSQVDSSTKWNSLRIEQIFFFKTNINHDNMFKIKIAKKIFIIPSAPDFYLKNKENDIWINNIKFWFLE